MMYDTGTLVWGAAKSVGNVWIITNGPAREIALLYSGRTKAFLPDFLTTKKDVIKPSSFLYELTPLEYALLTLGNPVPQWAVDFIVMRPRAPQAPSVALTQLPMGVVQKVEKALNVSLTPKLEPVRIRIDEDKCPISGNYHEFVPYTGLVQSFEYCKSCDKKRAVTEVHYGY